MGSVFFSPEEVLIRRDELSSEALEIHFDELSDTSISVIESFNRFLAYFRMHFFSSSLDNFNLEDSQFR